MRIISGTARGTKQFGGTEGKVTGPGVSEVYGTG